MRKITMLFVLVWTAWGFAQAKRYTFSQTVGAYSEIADVNGAVLGDSKSDTQYFVDSTVPLGGLTTTGVGFDIGFNFVFNGDTYNRFAVSTDGWISLGYGSAPTTSAINMTIPDPLKPLSSITTSVPDLASARIAALANDLVAQAGSSLLYRLDGVAPNRVLIVQWKNYRKKNNGDGDSFNFQIRLKETSNVVEFDYGTFVSNENPLNFQVGLRAEPGNVLSNFSNRSSNSGWANSVSGVAATDTMLLSDSFKPESGRAFVWSPTTCGSAKGLTVTNVNSAGATISWGAYIPTPSGYEYVVSSSSAVPTGSGTPVTVTTANVDGLSANTNYNVFVRTNCTSEYTPWVMLGAFTTCSEVTTIAETFNYTSLPINNTPKPNTYFIPSCWSTKGSTAGATVGVVTGGSVNRLSMSLPASPINVEYACAMLPAVSNLQAGTHQLRFKASSSLAGKILQVGYFTDAAATNFVQIGTDYTLNTTLTENILPVPVIANNSVRNLVFRTTTSSAITTNTIVYLDDVSWEPLKNCNNVSALSYSAPTPSSVKVKWTKGDTETLWQYVYSLSSTVANPNDLGVNDVTGGAPEVVIGGLQANTKYNVWVRSVCHVGYSNWVGPLAVSTTCNSVSSVIEDFDTYTSGVPNCWTKVGTTGNAGVTTITTPASTISAKNKLSISGGGVIAFPALTNLMDPNYQLKMNIAANTAAGTKFEIGYVTDLTNDGSFVSLNLDITCAADKVFEYRPVNLGTVPVANYLAFRVVGNTYYVDDISWEPVPVGCTADVTNVGASAVQNGTVTMQWKPGGSETQWQYALGSSTDINPNLLTPGEFLSLDTAGLPYTGYVKGNIQGLNPGTIYKVWVRALCSGNKPGSFVGPYIINTTCGAVDHFFENFDLVPNGQKLPNCWIVASGSPGSAGVGTPVGGGYKAPSGSYILSVAASTSIVVSMPAISNYNENTHRLTFLYRSSQDGMKMQVGFMKNPLDASTFTPIDGAEFTGSAADFRPGAVVVPEDFSARTSTLAFKVIGGGFSIDNVKWDFIPECSDPQDLKINTYTSNSIDISWKNDVEETSDWEYVIGNDKVIDPLTLLNTVATTNTFVKITDFSAGVPLQSETTYKVWVRRTKCYNRNTGQYDLPGAYLGPLTITTTCTERSEFYEDFEEIDSPAMPSCWRKVGAPGVVITEYPGIQIRLAEPGYETRLQMTCNSPAQKPVVAMPAVTLESFADHILKFRVKTADNVENNTLVKVEHSSLEVGFLTNPADPNSFVMKKLVSPPNVYPSALIILDKNDFGDVPLSSVLAFRNPGLPGDIRVKIYLDKISWELAPTAPPACVETTVTKDATCGNYANTISWPAAPGADGYRFSLGTEPGIYTVVKDLDDVLSTTFSGNNNTTYYYKIAPYNYAGANGCEERSFTTALNNCFCVSNPTSMDGDGIKHAALSGKNFDVAKGSYYNDFTGSIGNAPTTGTLDLKVVFDTSNLAYEAAVWVDFNDNYQFDENERMFTGLTPATTPGTLDASFIMPANSKVGVHYMRFVCRYGSAPDPCYSGEKGQTIDFKINVVNPVGNDLNTGAYPLTVGTVFETNPLGGDNTNATGFYSNVSGSYVAENPGCGDYAGADVWYKAIVPMSGELTFEVNSVPGGLTNTAGAVYSVNSTDQEKLDLVACDDSSSTAGDNQPKITVTGRVPGETLYFRVWDNGGDAYGAFKVSAYNDNPLGTEIFDTVNFNYYPIPVKDVLNVSFDKEISNITVLNLLGQTVIEKTINSTKGNVDMSGLSRGTYLVKVTAANQFKTIKVIKE